MCHSIVDTMTSLIQLQFFNSKALYVIHLFSRHLMCMPLSGWLQNFFFAYPRNLPCWEWLMWKDVIRFISYQKGILGQWKPYLTDINGYYLKQKISSPLPPVSYNKSSDAVREDWHSSHLGQLTLFYMMGFFSIHMF